MLCVDHERMNQRHDVLMVVSYCRWFFCTVDHNQTATINRCDAWTVFLLTDWIGIRRFYWWKNNGAVLFVL